MQISSDEGEWVQVSTSLIGVVDDDESIRRVILHLIRSLSYLAEPFSSAEELLAAEPARFDCLVVDLHMPGMGGLAMLERLSTAGLSVPSIIVSARPQLALFRKARPLGAVRMLIKPFSLSDLEVSIRQALDG